MVCFLREHVLIGFPEITVGTTTAIAQRNLVPQAATGRFTAIANHKGNDLSGSTAHHRPQPAFIEFFEHETPGFVIFQDIIRFGWQQSIFESGQAFDMFDDPSGNTLAMNIENPFQTSQTYAFLIGVEDERLLLFFASRFDSSTR